jgi:hypothetical protein
LPIGSILMTHFAPNATWKPRRLNATDALLQVLPFAVTARIQPQTSITILQKVTMGAINLKGKRGEAEKVVSILSKQI